MKLQFLSQILSRLRGGDKAIPVSAVQIMVNGQGVNLGIPLSKLTDYSSYLLALSKKIWILWRCSTLKAQVIAETDWSTFRGENEREVSNAEFDGVMTTPNETDTGPELMYRTALHLFATGNAFWLKDQVTINGQRPRRLYSLNPKRMTIATDTKKGVIGYTYFPVISEDAGKGVSAIPFSKEEVIHFKMPHPDNDFWGLGDVEPGEPLFNSFVNQATWEDGYWSRGATPTTLLIGKNVSIQGGESKFREMKARWEREYGGVKNAGKTAWLTGDWTKETMGMTVRDMEAIDQSKWTCEQIAHLSGVPLSMVGLQGAANYATARVDDVRFRRDTIKPTLQFIGDRITKDLLVGFDPKLTFSFNLTGLVNIEEITAGYAPWFDRGVFSINDIREMAGVGKKDEPIFDQHFINAGLLPLDLAGMSNPQQTDEAAKEIVRRFILGDTKRGGNGAHSRP